MPYTKDHAAQLAAIAKVVGQMNELIGSNDFESPFNILHKDPAERQAAEARPAAWMKKHGIMIPSGMTCTFKDNNWSGKICGAARGYRLCITYESSKGWTISIWS